MMGLRKRLAASAGIAILALSGCASQPASGGRPDASLEIRESLELSAKGWRRFASGEGPPPLEQGFPWTNATPSAEGDFPAVRAACTASNDRGSWSVVLPGRLEVVASLAPLELTCRADGYRDYRTTFKCTTPRKVRAAGASMGLVRFLAFIPPVGVVALPVVLGVAVGTAATGAAIGAALPGGPGDDDCRYFLISQLEIWMSPR